MSIDLSKHNTGAILTLYNDYAFELGEPQVKKFSDRATAEKRTAKMYERVQEHRRKNATPVNGKPVVEQTVEQAAVDKAIDKARDGAKEKATNKAASATESVPGAAALGLDFSSIRAGTNRAKVLTLLVANIDKPVSRSNILADLYGSQKDMEGALAMVFKGINQVIDANKIPAKITRDTNANKEVTFALSKVL